MKDGFVKVSAISPKVRVADPDYNVKEIIEYIEKEYRKGSKILVFPELSITAYTCGDSFLQNRLIKEALKALDKIVEITVGKKVLVFVGFPFRHKAKLYNTAVAINDGKILAIIPKTFVPNYSEFYEKRYFTGAKNKENEYIEILNQRAVFGTKLIFQTDTVENLRVSAEICEDLWVANAPSISHALAGANVIVNLSASDEVVSKSNYRKNIVETQSAKLYAAYIYASSGEGESTGDLVFSAHNIIAENGTVLAESKRYEENSISIEIDIEKLESFRQRENTFETETKGYEYINFEMDFEETKVDRYINSLPFIPSDTAKRDFHLDDILNIQAHALKKRIEHTNTKKLVLGISGGLDSTLALIASIRSFDLLKLDRKGIIAVTMPAFGTTDRTYNNACKLSTSLGASLIEVNISKAVLQHFEDIGQDKNKHDVTYENSQARERTQVLMDIANKENALVIGTGDLSELALGWATYNGDHMSMYAINSSIPKTLVRYLVKYFADKADENIKAILYDILDTPVSPELLPPKEGNISQITEDLVGPYELHDFFLYYMLRLSYSPSKIYRLAKLAFSGKYEKEFILKWLKTFYRRFFNQQFKRSCMPDGPKVGNVALSPRGDLRMPSDASSDIWIRDLENIND